MSQSKDFWIIGVGASAGGLEALTTFLRSLPEKPNAAFVVAQHLAPHSKSMMVELLGRQTSLPVIAIRDHLQLEPGVISIVPPNFDVTAVEGELRLTKAGNELRPKPSVDVLFQSIAKVYGRKAVGIILSGTGSDGTEGIRAIKENGGITIVQDFESAKYDGMPKSAIDTGLVDAILPAEKIGQELFNILSSRDRHPMPMVELKPIDQDFFNKTLAYLKEEIGTDFSQYKISTIQRRVEKRLAHHRMKSIEDYYHYIQGNTAELSALAQNMLVSVTSFFRDTEAYEAATQVLEEIIFDKKTGDDLRIWSAGCATGEEPYSLAFLINDIIERTGKMISVKIFASDLDHEAMATARSGFYTDEDVKGLSKEVIAKYFDRREKSFEVKQMIKDMIIFARQDLTQNPPFVKLDFISCRNVLIYFDASLQSRIFEIFHYALRPNGYLFLGKSESVNINLFEVTDRKEKIFKRINVISKLNHSGRYTVGANLQANFTKKKSAAAQIAETAPLLILKQFGISGVVIDEDSSILHIIGDVSDYISLPVGQADFRLVNLLNKNAVIEFSVLVKKSLKEDHVVRSRAYKVGTELKKSFSFSVKALPKDSDTRQLFLVAFEPKIILETEAFHHPELATTENNNRVFELEQEVAITKENLQTVIEELEVSNEELQSLNEELSSTNEELQASNEELETTNEELQSTNEELMTLNEELSVKSGELRTAYSSLDNIQTSINFPLVVLDYDLKILRFNPSSSSIFSLSSADLGLPITRASCHCEIPSFESNIRHTLKTGKITEAICETPKKIFQLRVHPSFDEHKNIIGAILVFFDNTDFLHAQEKLKTSDKRIRAIIDGSPTMVSLKDNQGRYLMVNQAFSKFFGITEDNITGKTDREIFSEEVSSQFRENDLEVLLKKMPADTEETIYYNGKEAIFRSNRFPLFGTNDRSPYAVGTVSLEMTHQIRAQRELEVSENRYKAMIEDQAVFVCRHLPVGSITFVNNSFTNFFGGSKTSKQDFYDILDPKDHKRVSTEISKINYDHPIIQYESRVTSNGSQRWVRWIHRGIFNDQHVITEYQAVGFDVTEIHNKTSDLLAKENLYTHVLEYTSDYLSVYRFERGQFYLESFNQSAAYYRGFGSQRLIGKNLVDLIDPSQGGNIISKFQKSVETNTISNFEEIIEGPGGNLYLSTTIVPIHDASMNVTRVVGLSRDITKLKRIEKALRDEKRNAETANSAKSDFLASMSHELRTPLNVIMGMSQLLLRGQMESRHSKLVESIQRSSKVLLSLIEDVLDLSKIEAGKINFDAKPFDMDQLTEDVVQSFESEANRKGIKLLRQYNVRPNVPLIGDEVRIKQVIINLIGNAIKFTEQGSVELTVALQSKAASKSTIYFEVKDSGIGIPEDAYSKIFHRFSQADSGTARKFGGTGLGLAISKQLVQLMNGTIGFTSEENLGSTFWFKIELPEAIQETDDLIDHQAVDLDFTKFKILAVDDNPESLKVLKYYFEDKNGYLDIAESGAEAIQLSEKNNYDLILMDMQMPGMDGLEASKRIKSNEKTAKLPVIALTANAMAQDREKCLQAGMDDYLTKPVDFDSLNMLLKQWIKQ
jgi:two-component system CheB/CheR fusion protein